MIGFIVIVQYLLKTCEYTIIYIQGKLIIYIGKIVEIP